MNPIPFDKRQGKIFYNGTFVDWQDAKVHVLNHGLHYASSVFEGTRMYNGKIFENTKHNERLHKSAEIMDFKIPYSVSQMNDICLEACKLNNLTEAYLRPVAFRGSEKMQISAQENSIHFAVAVWQWPALFADKKKTGIDTVIAQYRRPPAECAPVFAKAAGLYMIVTISKHQAEKAGFQDAIMLDYHGNIAEATGANFFAVFDGEIHTPTPDCFLNGITRQTVMSLAQNLGYKVIERKIQPSELSKAQEVFLTGTAAEVTRVASITNEIGEKYSFPENKIFLHLMEKYQELTNS
jgi:branched-chain amino acid aminotransferase